MKNLAFALLILAVSIYIFSHKKDPINLPNNTKILAFGDSLTYGIGADKGMSYPAQLSKLLNLDIVSSGVPGEVSEDGLKRLEKIIDDINPDILILCHGGNDILRRYDLKITKQNLKAMIQMAKDRYIRVILIGVPRWNGFLGVKTAKFYDKLAKELSVEYEGEILETIENDRSLKSDQVHPNTKGYTKLAKAIKKVILKE